MFIENQIKEILRVAEDLKQYKQRISHLRVKLVELENKNLIEFKKIGTTGYTVIDGQLVTPIIEEAKRVIIEEIKNLDKKCNDVTSNFLLKEPQE